MIPTYGLYISGAVALFFLLATITGLLIHWQNIVRKFYAFLGSRRWKQIWTDAHTVMGVISLPFQVMSIIRPEFDFELNEEAPRTKRVSLNELKRNIARQYPDHNISQITVSNYGHDDAIATFHIDDEMGLIGSGKLCFRMDDGTLMTDASRIPYQKSYG